MTQEILPPHMQDKHQEMEIVHLNPHEAHYLDELQGGEVTSQGVRIYKNLGLLLQDKDVLDHLSHHFIDSQRKQGGGGEHPNNPELEQMREEGMHGDTVLAVMPKELTKLLDVIIGGTSINPHTHKKQYYMGEMLGNIGKSLMGAFGKKAAEKAAESAGSGLVNLAAPMAAKAAGQGALSMFNGMATTPGMLSALGSAIGGGLKAAGKGAINTLTGRALDSAPKVPMFSGTVQPSNMPIIKTGLSAGVGPFRKVPVHLRNNPPGAPGNPFKPGLPAAEPTMAQKEQMFSRPSLPATSAFSQPSDLPGTNPFAAELPPLPPVAPLTPPNKYYEDMATRGGVGLLNSATRALGAYGGSSAANQLATKAGVPDVGIIRAPINAAGGYLGGAIAPHIPGVSGATEGLARNTVGNLGYLADRAMDGAHAVGNYFHPPPPPKMPNPFMEPMEV